MHKHDAKAEKMHRELCSVLSHSVFLLVSPGDVHVEVAEINCIFTFQSLTYPPPQISVVVHVALMFHDG